MPARRVIVTRPAREAQRWVDALRAAGLDAVALPLIVIDALPQAAQQPAAGMPLDRHDALMFVSAAAVEHFFASHADAVHPMAMPRCWATGPGTTRALLEAGIPAAAIDAPPEHSAQFDSEALWARVHSQVRPGARVLIVRGADAAGHASGRDWLARQVEAGGGVVDTQVAYRRLPPTFDVDDTGIALEGARGEATWLFSSSEAIANLCHALPDTPWRAARAVATHARIAQAAEAAGFGIVRTAAPTVAAVVASIEFTG
ncbi:uroporphyrinogen-III synthase [Variovorax rhizosphaerae]|uniref:Uroporphyrinogen-III synthase n=1 Tax=Variovorax rhizosphaerae TaxID=1836200 RepID=A0ABU8WG19_9BURK